jgi:amidase
MFNRFIAAQNTTNLQDLIYTNAVVANRDLGGIRGIDATLKKYNLEALIAPSEGITSTPAAIAGYPVISVPLGFLLNTTSVLDNEAMVSLNLPI